MSNYLIHRINFMKIFKIKMLKERQFTELGFLCTKVHVYVAYFYDKIFENTYLIELLM